MDQVALRGGKRRYRVEKNSRKAKNRQFYSVFCFFQNKNPFFNDNFIFSLRFALWQLMAESLTIALGALQRGGNRVAGVANFENEKSRIHLSLSA